VQLKSSPATTKGVPFDKHQGKVSFGEMVGDLELVAKRALKR